MADKTQSIKGASDKQLSELLFRLRMENEVQDLIRSLIRKSTPETYGPYGEQLFPQKVSTEAPIESLYHYGILGMRWGHRKGASDSVKTAKIQRKVAKAEARAAKNKEKILRSPRKLYKNRDKFNQEEIDKAMKRMKWERELRSLSRDEITAGSQYANAILSYGTAAVGAYGIYKSPLGQAVAKSTKSKLGKALVGNISKL